MLDLTSHGQLALRVTFQHRYMPALDGHLRDGSSYGVRYGCFDWRILPS